MSEIAKAYESGAVESKWYKTWLEKGCFKGQKVEDKRAYSIVIPPPNVTGMLTMGHVLNNTLQDILIRRARQQGQSALWLPGTDHAGIATQARVEKELRKEGKSRYDLGCEKFLEVAKKWRDDHGGIIIEQLKRLGASCDWDQTVHTLDADYSNSVITAFVKLYESGAIYRGKRMVNWCPVSKTALSDEEVIMKPQKSTLYKMRYELVDSPGEYLEISTTRPETIMGDTAVAVHPNDERYKHLIGKQCYRPFPKEPIPIVGDEAVEQDFGTGALKITPAHDKVDFEVGQRHNLPMRDVLEADGTLNELAGEEFAGMDRFKARKVAAEKLKELGLLIEEQAYENNVGYSERADVPIEPRVSQQWFLKYPKVEEAKQVVKEQMIKFYPQRWEKTYLHWLDNIQDWCISRQLWWGHRIPVWYKKGADRTDSANWHVSVEGPADPESWEQEEDVLDTWASAWLWPFATLGWPDAQASQKRALDYWYPTSALVTGPDIIFFWVSRMIMAALEFMPGESLAEKIPFKDVYFTGIIRDAQGRKMSKSLGNSPDPIDLMDKYGADGLRLGVMLSAPQGQDVIFSEERVVQGRNFCNKLWNAARFRQISGEVSDNSSMESIIDRLDPAVCDGVDHAMLAGLMKTMDGVSSALDQYEFSNAAQLLYNFFWGDFCDWYVEVSKTKIADDSRKENCLAIQDICLRQVLLMLHPFMPFITEELWQGLKFAKGAEDFIQNVSVGTSKDLLDALAKKGVNIDPAAISEIANIREFISQARSLKAQCNLHSKKDLTFHLKVEANAKQILEVHERKLLNLIGAEAILVREDALVDAPAVVTALGTLYLDIKGAIDVDAEKARLTKELQKLEKALHAGNSKLKDERFVGKAPAHIVEGAKKQLADTQKKYDELQALYKSLDN